MVSLRIDARFAHLALDYLKAGDRELLTLIAETRAASHIAAHARTVSISGDAPTARELVEQLLTSTSMADVDLDEIRARLSLIEADRETQYRCWEEAAAYLPTGALSDATLFLTIGYDIGVAVSGNASLNLAHPHFAKKAEELWFYCVHELHHAGFQKFHELPRLADIKLTSDLVALIRYLTTMEGLAVHAARRWRTAAGALESDSDYLALLDQQRMDMYEKEYLALYCGLVATGPRLLEEGDWEILEQMSTGDRLWYRVGARMAYRIENALGRDSLIESVVEGPKAFFDRSAEAHTPNEQTRLSIGYIY